MLALIDSDSLCYGAAFSCEKKGELIDNAEMFLYPRLEKIVQKILEDTKATDYKMFLSGKENYRLEVSSLYKANRKDMKRPMLLQKARDYLEVVHNAIVSQGIEADDLVCIEQTACMEQEIDCCIAHIDKDIDQQAGWHYRWPLRGEAGAMYYVTEEEGLRNLYEQALVGDKVDNIMYYLDETTGTWKKEYGLGKVGARKALEGCTTEKDFQLKCLDVYSSLTKKSDGTTPSKEDFITNMNLLYLLRTKNDKWECLV